MFFLLFIFNAVALIYLLTEVWKQVEKMGKLA